MYSGSIKSDKDVGALMLPGAREKRKINRWNQQFNMGCLLVLLNQAIQPKSCLEVPYGCCRVYYTRHLGCHLRRPIQFTPQQTARSRTNARDKPAEV